VGRKFLVAGRGGLNLTHSEPVENFPARYSAEPERWRDLLATFPPEDIRSWAGQLGIETFIGTSGRVFPTGKQAAPLLRRWVERLREQGVQFAPRHDWAGFRAEEKGLIEAEFITPSGPLLHHARALVLALGGASWPQTGSNGKWISIVQEAGVRVVSLTPANCGYEVDWPPDFLEVAEGAPLKNLVVHAGKAEAAGELLVTRHGLEGGALYQLGRALRAIAAPQIQIDLKPTFTVEQLSVKLAAIRGPDRLIRAATAWRLTPAMSALLGLQAPFSSDHALALAAKSVSVILREPRPIAEAISSSGGIAWEELDTNLMLRKIPGVFCAGEMIDWDAPTGGYLLQGCLATGTRAGRGAIGFLGRAPGEKKKLPSQVESL
jgi:uncharacterized flavoprotein (TIGR03862 family)